jgi:hypothetical protein
VAVPRRQPASVALVAGRRAEDGDFAAWKQLQGASRLTVGEDGAIRFTGAEGARSEFLPGRKAAFAGQGVEAAAYPRMASPFLSGSAAGSWSFSFEKVLPVPAAKEKGAPERPPSSRR